MPRETVPRARTRPTVPVVASTDASRTRCRQTAAKRKPVQPSADLVRRCIDVRPEHRQLEQVGSRSVARVAASRQADVDVLAGIDNVGHERTERVPLTQVGPDSSTGWCRTDFDESFVAGTEQAIEEMTGLAHRPRLIGVAHQVVAHRVQIQLKIASSYSVESVRWQRGQDSIGNRHRKV
jgi:hypothetical protein